MSRLLGLLALLVASTFVFARGAVAAPAPSFVLADDGSDASAPPVRTKDAGSIDGEVVSVDYRSGRFSMKVGTVTYDVVVLPSTDFEGHSDAFRGITDIKKGAHVSVMLSRRATTYVAQIIHLH